MSNLIVRKVAVLGAGVMGAQIAAHLINAKVPVLLFDLPAKEGPKNGIALKAIENLKKLSPAPFGIKDDARYVEPANYEDDLGLLAGCDLVIEAIAERMDWKHDLYKKVSPHLAPHAIFASNTSGLSITQLSDGFSDELKSRFCGVHFFNPPRYMHLVELIPTAHTRAQILDDLETFLTSVVGKGVVRAKDTPNFIANRVGVFSILAVMAEAAKFGLRFDEVDDLTGSRLGRAKSATFRTADVVGLDTMAHVIKTMQDNLPDDPFLPVYETPAVLAQLVQQGALGQKTGAGFYKKEGKVIKVLDPKAGQYVEGGAKADELVGRILKRPPEERLKLLRESGHPQAQFLWSIFRDVFHYIAVHLESIADNARDVDLAIRWGFGWNDGPFEGWQAAGWKQVAEWVGEDIAAGKALAKAPLPAWVFEGAVAEKGGVHTNEGSWSPAAKAFVPRSKLAVYDKQLFRAPLVGETAADPRTYGKTLFETETVRAWVDERAGENDVVIVSFKSKMNTIGPSVIDGLVQAIELAEKEYKAVVIWQPTSLKLGTPGGPFSAGANLEEAMPAFMMGGAKGIEPFVKKFQQGMLRVRYANVPVVAAVSGIALGGGCELLLHSAKRVAHVESYIGLVEVGVGLVPAGGGLKEAALRAADAAAAVGASNGELLKFLSKSFENAAMAKVSGSALEARQMGYLKPSDTIVFNVFELLHTARKEARALAEAGYRPPLPAKQIPVAGRSAIATIKAQLVNMRDGNFISAHDFLIASRIAEVVCGGEVEAGSLVDEEWLLTLERRAFVDLLGTQKTQERIMGMLQTGKPVRN
ncbi:3-hydroxyacyl-CoA dehydrogenase NAD-binding domain-containing protein [Trinickia caryophylli]|uniref:3-hydroxyacyl-CoA dehydrogenase n=1 Tax=Trinickia caryophylli TaxID=28094 RepID=A0A1X7ESS6_TRICW|nr:3-hydroxyacyl-CoA dehydrogenase NAD-binding domain-containing protein [Trinickia caryophylli]PMS12118.1 3-hydroxyacyl-CoA dehydrogenase [Trinickia caryophylli]TRX18576.1 3-hydroxyacyl-CoA dehydrogenase/enoyl-CoA hydratase family protein [Trinickia caryophylli]WQE10630.1 3-hydroxyacyl-CoA dehydrogenase NAD-binding domain-containing protein [Trinickia caryophylli]SMF39536.1 3-hydroxyacyl-CoA dehydrogenase [Trinickia caryophylli]GLU32997.1 3-hydroxyacyl-CoA dehydrogenase [Trinickia caryophylli